jgi:hypothetical protein
MTLLTEKNRSAEIILSIKDYHSREEVTIVSGQNLVAGAVVGKITTGGKYTAYDNVAVDGSQAAGDSRRQR